MKHLIPFTAPVRNIRNARGLGVVVLALAGLACGGTNPDSLTVRSEDAIDQPLHEATPELQERFKTGDKFFDFTYLESEGLIAAGLPSRASAGTAVLAGNHD